MTQWLKASAAKPKDLTHMVEERATTPQVILWPLQVHTITHTRVVKIFIWMLF